MSTVVPLLFVGLIGFVAGVEVGGRWASWIAMTAVRRAGVEWQFQRALEQLRDPNTWRNS